jgi:hypothetical protein
MEEVVDNVQTQEKVVNFLDVTQQKYDWRYETYSRLSINAHKTIHWIATVFLSEVSEKEDEYLLRYFSGHGMLVAQGERSRDVDGAVMEGKRNYHFNLSEFKPEMMKAKQEGFLFYTIFVEEYVDSYGVHYINGLYSIHPGEIPMYGISSYTPWYKMPVDTFFSLSHFKINDDVVHVPLLRHPAYKWLR